MTRDIYDLNGGPILYSTVDRLNKLSAAHNFLILLRALNTSDLAFTHMLLEKRTVQDIIDTAEGCLEYADKDGSDEDKLSPEETEEYLSHLENMRAYTGG